jgi:hypothetical protein
VPNLIESKLGCFGENQGRSQSELLLSRDLAEPSFGCHESNARRALERRSGGVDLAQEGANHLERQLVAHGLLDHAQNVSFVRCPARGTELSYLASKSCAPLQSAKHLDIRLRHLAAQIFDLSASIRHSIMLAPL